MRKSVLTLALSACLFLLIVGAKWATFDRYGSAIPDWDQWDAEAVELFIPWFERDHFLSHLFHPHNEHRIILTKLQNLALVLLNGQWDSRLEAVTNAMLHAALAVALWVCAQRWIAARWLVPVFILIAALFGLPLAWQNILGGFHSQQYWLLVLSFSAIGILPYARPWSAPWWLGVLSAALALGSMGSGLLAAAVVIVVVAWRLATREMTLRIAWPTLAFTAAILVFGLLTRVEVAWHQGMKAKTAHDFFFSIVHSLQWPLREANWAAAVLWLPWLVVLGRVVAGASRSRSEQRPNEQADTAARAGETIAALGGWVLVQVFATAYARGAGADYPASRYMDTLAFGATVNSLALGWLLTVSTPSRAARFTTYALGLAWLATLSLGLREVTERNLRHELPDAKKYYIKAEGHMRRYLATNDPKQLSHGDIPFPSVEGLIERLAHPRIRSLMALPIRAPMAMTESPTAGSSGFISNNAVQADWEQPPQRGLSPQTSPLDFATTWGSFDADAQADTKRSWRSAPLNAPLGGWLKFETAGDLRRDADEVRLTLLDASNGKRLAEVIPKRHPGNTWRAAYVRAPNVPFVVAATDASRSEWLAFSPPVEMAPLSYWAWQATRNGSLILYCTATATALLAGLAWIGKLKPPNLNAENAKDGVLRGLRVKHGP